jgi:hypothetical protein
MWVFGEPTEGMKREISAARATGIRIRRFTPEMEEIV